MNLTTRERVEQFVVNLFSAVLVAVLWKLELQYIAVGIITLLLLNQTDRILRRFTRVVR